MEKQLEQNQEQKNLLQNVVKEQPKQKQQKQQSQKQQRAKNNPLRIGVISSKSYREDLMYYNEVFVDINDTFGSDVELVIFGYDGTDDMPELFKDVEYEYVKPVSIIHYFKQLKSLNLDVIFIPLINNTYNATSENYNKFLEASAFNIPILVTDIHPYNVLVKNDDNGFLYKEKIDVISKIKYLLENRESVKKVGLMANKTMLKYFNFNDNIVKELIEIYV